MKFATVSKSIVLGLALVLATSAFAATKASLQLSNPVTVNGTTLKPGDYKVQWEGSGPNVELNILRGKNVVAKVSAHVIELQTPASSDAAVTRKNDSGAKFPDRPPLRRQEDRSGLRRSQRQHAGRWFQQVAFRSQQITGVHTVLQQTMLVWGQPPRLSRRAQRGALFHESPEIKRERLSAPS